MARITVQDCLEQVDNRFELVLAASQRARQISLGAEPRVPRENDKPTVLALREIAAGLVGREVLDEPEAESADVETETASATEAAGTDPADLLAAEIEASQAEAGQAEAGESAGEEAASDTADTTAEDADPEEGSAEEH